MSNAPEYLIRKRGLFYRPNSAGYTNVKDEAGRYTHDEAVKITHPNGPDGPRDGMPFVSQKLVADDRIILMERGDE